LKKGFSNSQAVRIRVKGIVIVLPFLKPHRFFKTFCSTTHTGPSSGLSINYIIDTPSPDTNYNYYATLSPTTSYYRPSASSSFPVAPVFNPSPSAATRTVSKTEKPTNSTAKFPSPVNLCQYWSHPVGVQQYQPLYWAAERDDGGDGGGGVSYQRKRKPFWSAVGDYAREMLQPGGNTEVIRVSREFNQCIARCKETS
jgi:hypothetical protein